jgi:hypothetical protein
MYKPQLLVCGPLIGSLAKDIDWPARTAYSGSPSWDLCSVPPRNVTRPALRDEPPLSGFRDRFTAARNEVHGGPDALLKEGKKRVGVGLDAGEEGIPYELASRSKGVDRALA